MPSPNIKCCLGLLALAVWSIAGLTGCVSSPTIATHPDTQVNFSNYHTFALIRPNRAPSDPNVTPDMLRQINDATRQAFIQRGLTEAAEDSADIGVLVHGGIQDKVNIVDWGYNYGRFHRWGWGMRNNYELQQYREGTLIIDVFDTKNKTLVWRGSAVADVDDVPDMEKVRSAVNTIVSRYPQ